MKFNFFFMFRVGIYHFSNNINLIRCTSKIRYTYIKQRQNYYSTKIKNNEESNTDKNSSLFKNYLDVIRWKAPIGTALLTIPCGWGLALASIETGIYPDLTLVSMLIGGSFLMRSAGCIINDLWDKDIDNKVERTKNRPITSGKLTVNQASFILLSKLTAAFGILLCMNTPTIILGASSLGLVIIYPFLKRVTHLPQMFLGLCMNYGCLVSYCEMTGSLSPSIGLLYTGGILWTVIYDTVYAHQDKVDDIKVGVKSTAIYFGENKKFLYSLAVGSIASFYGVCIFSNIYMIPYIISIIGGSGYLLQQIRNVNLSSPISCNKFFTKSQIFGWLILFGLSANAFLKKE